MEKSKRRSSHASTGSGPIATAPCSSAIAVSTAISAAAIAGSPSVPVNNTGLETSASAIAWRASSTS